MYLLSIFINVCVDFFWQRIYYVLGPKPLHIKRIQSMPRARNIYIGYTQTESPSKYVPSLRTMETIKWLSLICVILDLEYVLIS